MRDHIFSEAIGKNNDILKNCMYCLDTFGPEDKWKVDPHWFTTYISVTCSNCNREHRFQDSTVQTLEDILEKIAKKK
jgi:hypothetical protein